MSKKYLRFVAALFFMTGHLTCADEAPIEVAVDAIQGTAGAMKLYLGVFGPGVGTAASDFFLKILESCFSFDKRFDVTRAILSEAPSKKADITELFGHGFDAALFVTYHGAGLPIEWRLYDTKPGAMVCGKRYGINGDMRDLAYGVAEEVIRELLGQSSPFLTKIVFVERVRGGRSSALGMVDYDGSHYNVFYTSHRTLIAPVWAPDPELPFIIVSEFTPRNVRFVGVDMGGKRYPVIDRDGTNVGLAYANHMSEVVYGRSGEIWRYTYDEKSKQGTHRRLIRGRGVCASPTLMASGDVIYCCDGKIKRLVNSTGRQEILVGDGYCVAPAYSKVANAIVYSRRVKGVMQLCVYDMATQASRQLTYDYGDKVDPSWSPCGNYVAFCHDRGRQSRIAIYSMALSEYWFVTPPEKFCRCPAWSPRFGSAVLF